jgi:hypothetical protein
MINMLRPTVLFVLTTAMLSSFAAETASQKPLSPTENHFIQVKPPAFFPSAKLPHVVKSQFTVDGNAGQFLRAVVDENAEYDAPFSLSVLAPNGSELKPVDCVNALVYLLPETGAYRITFEPSGVEHTLRLTLLAHNDPLMDVGLKPEQVSIDLDSLERRHEAKVLPPCSSQDDYFPAQLTLTGDHISIRIMQVAGYNEFFSRYSRMPQLVKALQPGFTGAIDAKEMPEPNHHGAATVMTVNAEQLTGNGWHGWRWIEGSANLFRNYPDRLAYVFQGISNDGRFFVIVRADISHPDVQRFSPPTLKPGLPVSIYQKNEKDQSLKRAQLEKSLAAADGGSFAPSLSQLDQVIRSLKLSY